MGGGGTGGGGKGADAFASAFEEKHLLLDHLLLDCNCNPSLRFSKIPNVIYVFAKSISVDFNQAIIVQNYNFAYFISTKLEKTRERERAACRPPPESLLVGCRIGGIAKVFDWKHSPCSSARMTWGRILETLKLYTDF